MIYPYTTWRPTHYIRAEQADTGAPNIYAEDMQLHLETLSCEVWANPHFLKMFSWNKSNLHLIQGCDHYAKHFDNDDSPHLWHMPVLCTFGSSVNVAIQIASLSFDEIFLVGCDLGYKDGNPSHFDKNYETGHTDIKNARYANMDTLAAHMLAARSCPIPIYNATVGGELEVYPRVDFKSLF